MVKILTVIKRWFREAPTLDMFVATVDYLLHFIGLGITEATVEMTVWRCALLLTCFLPLCVTYVVGSLYHYAVVLRPSGDTVSTVCAAVIFLSSVLAIGKMVWIAVYRREICVAVSDARALGPAPLAAWSWRLSTLLVFGLVGGSCHHLLMPLVLRQRVLPEENIILPGLENLESSPDYELTYFLIAFAFITMLSPVISFYVLFIGFTGHVDNHFRLLSDGFLSLVERSTVDEVSSLPNTSEAVASLNHRELSKNISKLIQQHCKLITFTDRVKYLFNAILGFDFGIITLSLGLLLIVINQLGISVFLDFIIYLFGTLLAICLPGENVRNAADGLSTSVWCSGWEQFRAHERRSVLMVLRLSQRPQVLVAASFVMITYQTLMVILKTCFSIYTTFSAVGK